MNVRWNRNTPVPLRVALVLTIGCLVVTGHASDIERTPYGAIRDGMQINDSLMIPAWDGGLQREDWPAEYKGQGQHHPDPFADDKPYFTIDAKNLKQYEHLLTEGHKALLNAYPETFKMPVYVTRRSHSAPVWVYENIEKNRSRATLIANGNGIDGAYGGIPFPVIDQKDPQAGLKVIWNHITRFRGVHVVRDASEVSVHQNGDYQLVSSVQEVDFVYYHPHDSNSSSNHLLFQYLSATHGPARLAGDATLVHEPLNHTQTPRQAWKYNAGLRRVRRAPSLAFDAPIPAADGLRTADDTDLFNGSPELYDWTLIGVKPLIIPYNNFKLDSPSLTYKELLQPGHIKSDVARFEAHRVWIIEAILKEGQRHIYAKRRFYIDEDSWSIAVVDQYDVRGNLWRVSVAYLKNYYDLPTTWSALDVFYDLQAKRYHAQFLDNESETTLLFSDEVPDQDRFRPQYLRRMGRR